MHYSEQPRDPRGQWVETGLAKSTSLTLTDERLEALTRGDDVRAVYTQAAEPAGKRGLIDKYWDNAMSIHEYDHRGTVPKMADDDTPNYTGGHALSRRRRTHRWAYDTGIGKVRIPNRTAVNRFMDRNGYTTIDLPVVYTHNDQSVQTTVRVTRYGKDKFEVQALSASSPEESLLVSEAVNAALEKRRVKGTTIEDIYRDRQAKRQMFGIAMTDKITRSSFIKGGSYNRDTGEMLVMLKDKAYTYKIDEATYLRMRDASVPGSVYSNEIRGKYESSRASQCSACGRFVNEGVRHVCPIKNQREYAVSTMAQHRAAMMSRRGNLPEDHRPDLRPWLAPATNGNTGFTRELALSLMDRADAVAVPGAYKKTGRRIVRNGSNGTLNVAGVQGRDARRMAALMGPLAENWFKPLVQLTDKHQEVSFTGTIYGPTLKNEGVEFRHLKIDDKELAQFIKDKPTNVGAAMVAHKYGIDVNLIDRGYNVGKNGALYFDLR